MDVLKRGCAARTKCRTLPECGVLPDHARHTDGCGNQKSFNYTGTALELEEVSMRKFIVAACAVVATSATLTLGTSFAAAPPAATGQSTLDTVRARGHVQCGVNTGLAGFSQPDSKGVWRGLDVDVCRAVASAVFGDPTRVRYTPLSAQQRFTALQSGEIDILSRNTTWTLSRDTSLGLNFVGVNYYDGQGFMVPAKLRVKSVKQLSGATICVQPGTTTELNLADYFRANKMTFKPVVIEKLEEVLNAYFAGRCDVYTTDISGLVAVRASRAPTPAEHIILPEVISKEPLGPAVRHGDERWYDLVKWSLFAMIEAEELGLNSQNIDQHLKSINPAIQRVVGATGDLGKMLGVDNRWAYNIIRHVGNYGESFERNLTPLGFERGLNRLWTEGGLIYAPPIR
jgi:general L-amino acid transport system substrate-binding protein